MESPNPAHHHHHHRHKYRWLRKFTKGVIIGSTASLGAVSAALVLWGGGPYIIVSMLACSLTFRVAFVNDRKGFPTRSDRHAHDKFEAWESLLLGMIVLLNVTAIFWSFFM